jgi:hypothetical protein
VLTGPPPAPGVELIGSDQRVTLPTTVPPAQIPELASVGLALSPFEAGIGYATTAPRRRALWLELKEPIANDKGDALFARVLGHGADALLYNARPDDTAALEPPLVLDPELMREIVPGESDDCAGVDAMQKLERAGDSKVHFLLPLPPGVEPDDPELFGFWTYEFRIGHACLPHDPRWWSTANGRFGRPLRVSGVQHPAPPLSCRAGRVRVAVKEILDPAGGGADLADVPATLREAVAVRIREEEKSGALALEVQRFATFVRATAPYATPVLNGRALVRPTETPRTTLCFFLYAQVVQADAASNRNVLLLHRYGTFHPREGNVPSRNTQRDRTGDAMFSNAEIIDALTQLGLPETLPLSMLAAELLPGGTAGYRPKEFAPPPSLDGRDPLGTDLTGTPQRILRVSPLVAVAPVC